MCSRYAVVMQKQWRIMRIDDDIDLHISYGKCFEKFPQNVHVYIIKLHNCENPSNASHFLI